MGARSLAIALLLASSSAAAQDADPRALADAVEARVDCDITVHGQPRFDEFAQQWLVAYSAAGADCDAAAAALRREGTPHGIAFFRRPDRAQVLALVADVRREVEAAFGCRILLRSEPRLVEGSGYWTVSYVGAGSNCADADEELRRRGRDLQIYFLRAPDRFERNDPLLVR